MRLLAGERKKDRRAEYLSAIVQDRQHLVYFKRLYREYPFSRNTINSILKHLANEIVENLKNLKELERLKGE